MTSISSPSVSEPHRPRRPGSGHATLAAAFVLSLLTWAASEARAADPTTRECLAASEASLTLRRHHQLREAHAQLLICSAPSCPGDVRDECLRRAGELKATMPTVVFIAQDGAGNDLTAVKVAMDGQAIADHLEGTALAVDPGEHTFTFALAGRGTVEKKLVIHEGEKARREKIVFQVPAAPAAASDEPTGSPALLAHPPEPTTDDGSASFGTQRIWAVVAAGAGVVAVGVGVGFGLDAMAKHDQAKKVCPDTACPDQNGVDLWNQASHAGTVSTVAFVAGGVALAGAAALWFTAPDGHSSSEDRTARISVGPAGLLVSGVW